MTPRQLVHSVLVHAFTGKPVELPDQATTWRCMDVLQKSRSPEVTVWFDGGCHLCRAEIALYRKLDARPGKISFVDLLGEGTCPLDRADMLARFHAQEAGQPLVSGAAAFGALWRHVTPFQPLGWMAKWPPMLWLMERAYRGFLRIRPRVQAWFNRRHA